MEILLLIAVLLPFALGGWLLAIVAYGRARGADRKAAELERRVAALEAGGRRPPPAPAASSRR